VAGDYNFTIRNFYNADAPGHPQIGDPPLDANYFNEREQLLQDMVSDITQVVAGKGTVAQKPLPTSVVVGAQYYATDLSKPIWSDGTSWRDASGTIIS